MQRITCAFYEGEKKQLLKEIGIDSINLKKLEIKQTECGYDVKKENDDYHSETNKRQRNCNTYDFLLEIFSIFGKSKYLESFSLKIKPLHCNPYSFEPLNTLKYLHYIEFSDIYLSKPFVIDLPNLQKVNFRARQKY